MKTWLQNLTTYFFNASTTFASAISVDQLPDYRHQSIQRESYDYMVYPD
ncbi:MAG: hypothetical protein ACK41T_07140 [Pseudobdellovibrio sp.]